ncbi:WXG100-like domain-containing protein [Saccharothrix hoggarensis]|uniref:PPE family protein n=1 Tax=Saccharothrix hoggarensis TaxID=913853 RepID=A0ABW3QV62_9PSEU
MVEWTGFNDKWNNPDNYAGGGAVESFFQLADSCTRAEQGDYAEIGMNAAALGLDVLGMVMDPLGSLATAGIGWLIEHVSFLREPLDWLAGNGDRIKAAVKVWNETATALDQVAQAQHDAVSGQVSGWEEQAAERFRQSQGRLVQETLVMSRTCVTVAEQIATAGTITAAIRGMIRDLIAMFVWEVIRNAAIALASSVVSFGSSIAAFAAWAVGRGAVVLGKITQQIAKLMRVVTRIMGRLKGLFGALGDALKGLARFGKGGGAATRASGTPGGVKFEGLENAGKRMEDWGNARPTLGDAGTKLRDAGREFGDGYKNAGDTWKKVYEDKVGGTPLMEKVGDAYTPYKPLERNGHVSPHSVPDVMGGGFQTKFGADVLRETSKQDELELEGVPEERQPTFKRQTGYLDE